ncbi:MAG: cytochrome c [Acidobacteriota bacterium]|nr:cytochrome c [Acidobacteriota bacterium]
MSRFIGGFIAAFVIAGVVGFWYLDSGRLDTQALGQKPPAFEAWLAGHALDASVARREPAASDRIGSNDTTLAAGGALYDDHCAVCHGTPSATGVLADALYPPAPQFSERPPDPNVDHDFYVIKYGIRWTGMPGWGHTLSDRQIWTVVTYLKRFDSLPPSVALRRSQGRARWSYQ